MIRNADDYDFGGGERFPVENATILRSLGYQVTIVSRNERLLAFAQERKLPVVKGWWWSRQNWGGWRITLLPVFVCWQVLLFFWYIRLFLCKNPNAVHVQSRDDFIAGTLAGRLLGKRVIWTDHADLKYIYVNHGSRIKNPIGKLVFICSQLANTVTLVSNSEKNLVTKTLDRPLPSNYRVIHNGVRSEDIKRVPRIPSHRNDVIFACTSRLVKTKGIGELMRAFIKTQERYPTCRLYIFGEGPGEAQFKKIATNNERIEFKGFPPNTLNQLADCDVFVHPSHHEGFSISLIEAAKLGLAIVACPVGGNTEIITNGYNGLLVPVSNVDVLADAMIKLAKNPNERHKLGNNAKRTYRREFILEDIIKEKFIPLYE